MGEVMRLEYSGVMELVERLLDIYWHRHVQYAGLVVPVQCDTTVKTPCPTLLYVIFYWSVFMRYWAYSLLWYLIKKPSTTRVNVILFLLWHHNTGVIGAGSYLNGRR